MAQQVARGLGAAAKLAAAAGVVSLAQNHLIYNVEPGYRAIRFNQFTGVDLKPKGEGTHFKVPFFDTVNYYETRSQPRVVPAKTGTKDLQTVQISLRVLYHPQESWLPKLFMNYGIDYDNKILPSIVTEVLKAVVARYNADQLLTMRDSVSKEIDESLENRLRGEYGIILDDVSITHLSFGAEFARANEDKQVARQDVDREKFQVARAEEEKKVKVILSEGDAEAATLINKSLEEHGNAFLEVRKIDTAIQVANNLRASRNVAYLPGGSNGNNLLLSLGVQ